LKYLIFLGDGMADLPVAELGNRTPLEVASKPAMDRIARDGQSGTFVTVEDDMPPGSEVANLSVLGYDPKKCHEGRGVLEAASMGVELTDTDVAMRCNLLCLKDGRIKNHSAGHIPTEEGAELIRFLDRYVGNDDVRFFPGISYRHLLVLGENMCALPDDAEPLRASAALDLTPPHDHVGEVAAELLVRAKTKDAEPTAALLNDLIRCSWRLLPQHPVNVRRVAAGKDPANSIWPWSAGRKPKMATYQQMFGLTGAVISAVDLIRGVGKYAGLDVIDVPGATGLIDTNFEGKADACLAALRDHDFVYVHVEAADEAGHSRDVKQKVQAIEFLDQRLIARVMKGLEERRIEATVAVLPDHPTPVATGNHIHGAVPVAIMGKAFPADSVQRYDEESARAGALGQFHGDAFIRAFLGR
jgi:2,3-bisphosphoglycerate-independent phosphoglycerate mutase